MSDDEQHRLEKERAAREAEELESFRRRGDWWRRHYGDLSDEEAAELMRRAGETAERLEKTAEDPPSSR